MNNNSFQFPPNFEPQSFAWLAVIIGSACVGHFTANEQNALGNWFTLVGQFLETTGAQQQLIEARLQNNNININSKQFKSGGSFYTNSGPSNQTHRNEIDFLLDAVAKLQQELENLKNSK